MWGGSAVGRAAAGRARRRRAGAAAAPPAPLPTAPPGPPHPPEASPSAGSPRPGPALTMAAGGSLGAALGRAPRCAHGTGGGHAEAAAPPGLPQRRAEAAGGQGPRAGPERGSGLAAAAAAPGLPEARPAAQREGGPALPAPPTGSGRRAPPANGKRGRGRAAPARSAAAHAAAAILEEGAAPPPPYSPPSLPPALGAAARAQRARPARQEGAVLARVGRGGAMWRWAWSPSGHAPSPKGGAARHVRC